MKEKEKEIVKEFLLPWVRGFVFCFSNDSTEKWKKMFCQKRLETFLATDKDMIEERTGVKLDNQKNLNDFKKIYESLFMEEVEKYLTELKKTKDEETREKIKREGVTRKVDSSSNSKKKTKKK
jgi:hypothetical protein